MPNDEVYVPMKGWVKPSCWNCAENHIECCIMAILRDHLVEYFEHPPGHVEMPEDWEREKIDFAQWHCSRWQLDTEASRLKVLERKIGSAEMQAILQEKEQRLKEMKARAEADMEDERREIKESVLKQPELSLLSAAELNDLQKPKGPWTPEAKDTLKCPACGNNYWQHGPRGGLAENIRCTKCGRIYNTELTGLVLVGRDTTNLPDGGG